MKIYVLNYLSMYIFNLGIFSHFLVGLDPHLLWKIISLLSFVLLKNYLTVNTYEWTQTLDLISKLSIIKEDCIIDKLVQKHGSKKWT